ncbi:Uncharacterized protein FKW44_019296 [Caligus rogercresseyi]|uniref:Uncharacterized protein n=1 Tax=Caligus rogercresseyi TaxID=217165 RepID=A0A7T8GVL8_CALRO|nr:Uncharacterized protein FKW44_019296 [Caligus rogercresseyi]
MYEWLVYPMRLFNNKKIENVLELSAGRPLLLALRCAVRPRRIHRLLQISQSYCLQHCQVLPGVGGHRGRIPNTGKKDSRPIPRRKRSAESRHVLSKEFWPPAALTSTPATTTCGAASLRGTLTSVSQHCGLLESCHNPVQWPIVQGTGGSCRWEVQAPCGGCVL